MPTLTRNIHQTSGEELLLMAIFGDRRERSTVKNELERRSIDMTSPRAARRSKNTVTVNSTVAA
ncbi:MAG: hypothetical protein GC162_18430 [Planctomycetes bacterium]|nr:hypothetical protein [Planctomycetota bacterium]